MIIALAAAGVSASRAQYQTDRASAAKGTRAAARRSLGQKPELTIFSLTRVTAGVRARDGLSTPLGSKPPPLTWGDAFEFALMSLNRPPVRH